MRAGDGSRVESVFRASSASTRYERIRTVGKGKPLFSSFKKSPGAFGSAVLYRRKEDGALVIIKEINMYELDSQQRQLSLNEVNQKSVEIHAPAHVKTRHRAVELAWYGKMPKSRAAEIIRVRARGKMIQNWLF